MMKPLTIMKPTATTSGTPMNSAGRVAARYSVSVSSGSMSAAASQGLAEIGGPEHDDDATDDTGDHAQRGAAKHPQHTDGDDAENCEGLTERAKNKGADVVEHRLRTGAARYRLGERKAGRNSERRGS